MCNSSCGLVVPIPKKPFVPNLATSLELTKNAKAELVPCVPILPTPSPEYGDCIIIPLPSVSLTLNVGF